MHDKLTAYMFNQSINPPPCCLRIHQVRDRLERKLERKHRTGFSFNFELDDYGDKAKENDPGGRGSFRFGFNPNITPVDVDGASNSKAGRASGAASQTPIAEGFVVNATGETSVTATARKKKGTSKKKKRGKGNKKAAGQMKHDLAKDALEGGRGAAEGSPPKCTARTPSAAADQAINRTNEVLPLAEYSRDTSQDRELKQQPALGAPKLSSGESDYRHIPRVPTMVRPPPGLTMESWKDPALTSEERRRRRFGRGVRNMTAIQRSRDARRGALIPDGEMPSDSFAEDQHGLAPQNLNQARAAGLVGDRSPDGDQFRGGGGDKRGASSVFAFGFDIGISFDGGS